MSCHWRARFELRAECGAKPPGGELSAGRVYHGDVTTVDELHLRNPVAKHNRDIDHLVEGHTHDGRVKLVQELHLRNLHGLQQFCTTTGM